MIQYAVSAQKVEATLILCDFRLKKTHSDNSMNYNEVQRLIYVDI